jgi:hypothetical protein
MGLQNQARIYSLVVEELGGENDWERSDEMV